MSFAAVAGTTLHRKQAAIATLLICLVNQLYGYTIRHYPPSVISFLWGLVMVLGAIAVTLIASFQPKFSRQHWWGHFLWLGIALLLGFGLYQSSTLLLNQWVGMHGLTAFVLLRIFVRELVWTFALFSFHSILVWNNRRTIFH